MYNKLSSCIKEIFIRYFYFKINRKSKKKVLLSFIVHPFLKRTKSHPNSKELFTIVSILKELDYEVTVVDYRRKKIFGNYDLVLGFGNCYEYALLNKIAKKYVLYSTGSPCLYQNQKAIEAIFRYEKSNSNMLQECFKKHVRFTESIWLNQLLFSDAIITIGNERTKKLFGKFHNNVYTIPAMSFELEDKNIKNELPLELNSFLWFGGKGSIHKGLDLCIDAAIKTNSILYVAGPLDDEIYLYQDKISKNPNNIKYVGFLDIESSEFDKYCKTIPFTILPSCSEGIATSIITLSYNYGTIPLLSKECGFDYDSYIYKIESLDLESVIGAIQKVNNLNLNEVLNQRECIKKYFRKKYSQNEFYTSFKNSLLMIENESNNDRI
ncbi:hypothetical protein [Photobacterium leiognathi]|uniref:hypothetical protein n=1 Tax=Photobacterium leiognathi TaxID=553611 RepID=UPI002980ABE7|nr:hypothetical protein [Photobacterium leiognathi]